MPLTGGDGHLSPIHRPYCHYQRYLSKREEDTA